MNTTADSHGVKASSDDLIDGQAATLPQPVPGEPEPIDLLSYLRGLAHHWLAGLITAVVVAALVFAVGMVAPKDKVGSTWAKAHVMVSMPAPASAQEGQLAATLVPNVMNTYVALKDADPLVNATVSALGKGTDADTVRAACAPYWGGGGLIIAFYCRGTDLAQAQDRTNAYAKAFIATANTVLPAPITGGQHPTLTLVEPALPSDPNPADKAGASSLSSSLTSPVAAVAVGILAGLAMMALLELRTSRRSTRQARR